MTLFEAVILGIVQGLTEFLPISSSGHLVLGEFLLEVKFDDISFEVFLHFGTFLSVVVVFRRNIWSMARAVWLKVRSVLTGVAAARGSEDLHLVWMIFVGSLPAGLAGLLFKSYVEASFSSVLLVSIMLLFTGTALFLTRFFRAGRVRLKWGDALLVGLAQALAMLPGVSRSGLTISTAIFARVDRSRAAEFSFLLSLPAILGASLVELKDVSSQANPGSHLGIYLVGAATAFAVGYLAIKFLLEVIRKGKFQYFAYYCLAVGLLFLIFAR
ncbi:MAG: undecaprenyl-diphosphate phosphatase [Candidatus Zixiibacteriota bacterium]|nr:MAG: undecaprenyl-diphosphate phosphatase [candidate division Zixibacteria bacterium]